MGEVTQIDPLANEVIATLRARLEDAERGEIDGLVMVSVYKKGTVIPDVRGAFSADPEELARFLGYLESIKYDLYSIATEPDEDD